MASIEHVFLTGHKYPCIYMASIEHVFLTGHKYPCIYMASIEHTFLTGHKSTYDHTQLHFFQKLEFYLSILFSLFL